METVRFRYASSLFSNFFSWMTYEQLKDINKDSRVPKRLLIEALMAKITSIESPGAEKQETADPNVRAVTSNLRIPSFFFFQF